MMTFNEWAAHTSLFEISTFLTKLALVLFYSWITAKFLALGIEHRKDKNKRYLRDIAIAVVVLEGLVLYNNIHFKFDIADWRMWAAVTSEVFLYKAYYNFRSYRFHDMVEKVEIYRYFEAFFSCPDVFIIADRGQFVEVNTIFENEFGWKRDEVIGKAWVKFIHSDDLKITQEALKQVVAGKISTQYVRIRCKDDSYKGFVFKSSMDGKLIYSTGRKQEESKIN